MMLKVHQGNFQNEGGMFHMHTRVLTIELTLGHIGTVGLSPYISLVFPKIFMARGR